MARFVFNTKDQMLAAAAGVAGTAATDYLLLNFDASVVDSDFTGMSGLDQIILRGTGAQSIALGETAAAAFGPG
ncbi:hypothetical protein [Roseomonas harenae]|uniref:hypothetical protein n=1 Tax=Muricoccus harenae TaxID=2692566 RepID=UPI00133168C0|nr:hypothetical protein [Roseomonas harenae]